MPGKPGVDSPAARASRTPGSNGVRLNSSQPALKHSPQNVTKKSAGTVLLDRIVKRIYHKQPLALHRTPQRNEFHPQSNSLP
jgi:hypothetical protein